MINTIKQFGEGVNCRNLHKFVSWGIEGNAYWITRPTTSTDTQKGRFRVESAFFCVRI